MPARLEALDPVVPEASLVAVPRARELAALLGDRAQFQLKRPWVAFNLQDDGKTWWVSVCFESIARGEQSWTWPNLDCHITLLYIEMQPSLFETRVEELKRHVARISERRWVAAGIFNEISADFDYAWADLLVSSPVHEALHSSAAVIHGGRRAWGTKAAFHLSFRTPRR